MFLFLARARKQLRLSQKASSNRNNRKADAYASVFSFEKISVLMLTAIIDHEESLSKSEQKIILEKEQKPERSKDESRMYMRQSPEL